MLPEHAQNPALRRELFWGVWDPGCYGRGAVKFAKTGGKWLPKFSRERLDKSSMEAARAPLRASLMGKEMEKALLT